MTSLALGLILGWMLSNVVAVQTRCDLYMKFWSHWPQREDQTDRDTHPLWARLVMRILL